MKRKHKLLLTCSTLLFASLACKTMQDINISTPSEAPATATPYVLAATAAPTIVAPIVADQPFKISGTFKSTSEIGGDFADNVLFAERQVLLFDMHGFIIRDRKWILPVTSQVLGSVEYNPTDASGTYTLSLPLVPQGTLNDVDNNGKADVGVQVFAVDYEPNISADPFLSGDDRLRGWPGNQSSVTTTADEANEVTGGSLIVYAPDGNQSFPSDFGPDKKLFTADDPVTPLPAGYSVINLDSRPFGMSRAPEVSLDLFEASDAGPKDYSTGSYTQAFDNMVTFLRKEYAFNGIEGKQPDWDALVGEIRPRILQAEQDGKAYDFYAALRDFSMAFKDGHVGIDGGDFSTQDFQSNYAGSYGFSARVLDGEQVIASTVIEKSSAEAAGIKPGAVITEFDGVPVMEAIKAQKLFFFNQSSEIGRLYYQAVMLTRAKPGNQAKVTFKNPGGNAKTVTLKAAPEIDQLLKDMGYNQKDDLLPVELNLLEENGSQIGYIKLNTNADDLNLILRLFERGLKKFEALKVDGIIIDLRSNSGGVPLGLAGFLTDKEIMLGQTEYYDEKEGKFMPPLEPDKVIANKNQYRFDKIAVLVGLNCASACEIEAYSMGQIDGAVIVGQYPSSGIEAEVSKGQVKMPEGISLQFPTGRIINPDGSLFLEGVGVQPTIKVPLNIDSVLSSKDYILQAAINHILGK